MFLNGELAMSKDCRGRMAIARRKARSQRVREHSVTYGISRSDWASRVEVSRLGMMISRQPVKGQQREPATQLPPSYLVEGNTA
jgi:hypothetical protein